MIEKRKRIALRKEKETMYQRIIEVLSDYWLDEPEETYVEVSMYFEKNKGEEYQTKVFRWGIPHEYSGNMKEDEE